MAVGWSQWLGLFEGTNMPAFQKLIQKNPLSDSVVFIFKVIKCPKNIYL